MPKKSSHSFWAKLLIGIAISSALIYFAAKDVSLDNVMIALRNTDCFYVACSLAAMFMMQVLRSVRWGLLLRPLIKLDQLTLFSVTSVGFLAIISLPMRLGELVKPYIMAKRTGMSVTSAISSVIAERIFDALAVFLFIALVPLLLPTVPDWLFEYTAVFFVFVASLAALMIFVVCKQELSVAIVEKLLNKRGTLAARAKELLIGFIAGLEFAKNWRLTLLVFVLSIAIWLTEVVIIYYMLLAFGIVLPLAAYFLITAVLLVAIAIPAAPGFIGSWHYACVLGLSFFGVAADLGFAFGALYHFGTIVLLGMLGLLFLPGNYSAIKEVVSATQAKESN
ncbi:MAG: flippase-like domain-containing protein [Deltaproteobacteria bacterium]|nr:flippase-like domain-containing protein [Deltaproteobacteria bacterium]